jgi:hypothetical protein
MAGQPCQIMCVHMKWGEVDDEQQMLCSERTFVPQSSACSTSCKAIECTHIELVQEARGPCRSAPSAIQLHIQEASNLAHHAPHAYQTLVQTSTITLVAVVSSFFPSRSVMRL